MIDDFQRFNVLVPRTIESFTRLSIVRHLADIETSEEILRIDNQLSEKLLFRIGYLLSEAKCRQRRDYWACLASGGLLQLLKEHLNY